jgi:Spy/CpxP family protein refolding chaperone
MILFQTTHARGKSLAAFIVAALLLPLLLFSPLTPSSSAQVQDAPEPQENGAQPRRARRDSANLLSRLNLSPAQLAQLREIRVQSEQQLRPLTRRLNVARRALDEAIYSDEVNETLVEERAREVSAAQAALVRLRAQTELRVRRVLSAEQLQSFRNLRQRARMRQRAQRRLERRNQRTPRRP